MAQQNQNQNQNQNDAYVPMKDLFDGKYCHADQLKVGDWTSGSIYYRVINTNPVNIECKDLHGSSLIVGSKVMESEMISASQYDREEKVTRTEMAEILVKTGRHVFTVTFHKQVTSEDMIQILEDEKYTSEQPATKKRKTCEKAIKAGASRTITGFLCNTEHLMGRSMVIDLNEPSAHKERQVDHRTLESLIFQRVRYILK